MTHNKTRRLLLPIIAMLLSACSSMDKKPSSTPVFISQEEKRAGEHIYGLFKKHYGFYDNPALESYIKSILFTVLPHTPARNTSITFRILDTSLVNARATPGGYIYITKGLLALANNESQIAAILSHEIAHIVAGHTKEKYKQNEKVLKVSKNINRNVKTDMAKQVTGLFSKVVIQGNQREKELEADRLALLYISKTRYQASSILSMLKLLKNFSAYTDSFTTESGDTEIAILSTHPSIDRRIDELKKSYVSNNFPDPLADNIVIDEQYLNKINGLVLGKIKNRRLILSLKQFPDYKRYSMELKKNSNSDRIVTEYIQALNYIPAGGQNSAPLQIKWIERK